MFLLRFKYRVSLVQWRAVIKVDGGAAGDVGNSELRPPGPAAEGNIVWQGISDLYFFVVVRDQGQHAFHTITSRARADVIAAAPLADVVCNSLPCQFEEPVEGCPSPSR